MIQPQELYMYVYLWSFHIFKIILLRHWSVIFYRFKLIKSLIWKEIIQNFIIGNTLWYQLSCHISKDIYLIVIIGWLNKAFLRKQKKMIFRIISYSVVGLYRSCNSVLYKECYHQPWIQKYKFFKNLRNNIISFQRNSHSPLHFEGPIF